MQLDLTENTIRWMVEGETIAEGIITFNYLYSFKKIDSFKMEKKN